MAKHGLFDVGSVAKILDCYEEQPDVDEDVLGYILQDEFEPSVSEYNGSTSTDEALREIAIALQEEQKPPVLLETKSRFKTLTEEDLQTIEDTRQSSATRKKTKWGGKIFQVGHSKEESEQRDGFVSSILLLMSFTGILFAFLSELWMDPKNKHFLSLLNIYLYVSTVVSLVSWIMMCFLAKYKASEYLITPRNDPVSSVVNIWYGIFGVGLTVYYLLTFLIFMECYLKGVELSTDSKISGLIMRIVFLCFQTTCLIYISRFQFKRRKLTNYSFSTMLLSNVMLYLWTAFALIYGIHTHIKTKEKYTNNNQTTDLCVNTSLMVRNFLKPLSVIIFSMHQEYYLLTICLIASMFPSIANFSNKKKDHGASNGFREPLADDSEKQNNRLHASFNTIFVAALSIVMFIPGFVVLIIRQRLSSATTLSLLWSWCVTLPTILVIVVMLMGFSIIQKVKAGESAQENYRGYIMDNDALYILTSVGSFMNNGVALVFAIIVKQSTMETISFAIIMMEIYYQTILIISLKKIDIKRVRRLQYVILFLLFPNCLWWMYDRLAEHVPNFDDSYDILIGSSWSSLKQIIQPLAILYRFQSVISLCRMWKVKDMNLNDKVVSNIEADKVSVRQ